VTCSGLKYGRTVGSMDVTSETEKVLLRLPVWIDMTQDQLHSVIDAVKEIAAALPAGLQ
jgi:dTDP-4-amino-4,6-dideoxygalactose transaminase